MPPIADGCRARGATGCTMAAAAVGGGRGGRGGGGRESCVSLSDSISISPTSVMSSLAVGSEVAVLWARSSSLILASSFSFNCFAFFSICL